MLTSADGNSWTNRMSGVGSDVGHLNAVTWKGSQYVAVGNDGRVITSPNAVTWTRRTVPQNAWLLTNYHLFAVHAAGALVTAEGFDGTVITSTDGVTWTSRSILDPANANRGVSITLYGVVRGTSNGWATVGRAGHVWSSPDAVTSWTNRTRDESRLFLAVAHDGSRFCTVGVGYEGAIQTSANGVTWGMTETNISRFLQGHES